jgi:hypothetical protein
MTNALKAACAESVRDNLCIDEIAKAALTGNDVNDLVFRFYPRWITVPVHQ